MTCILNEIYIYSFYLTLETVSSFYLNILDNKVNFTMVKSGYVKG